MDMLREILENLISLSFSQESLISKTSNASTNSTEFIEIAQKQNNLKDDSKIIKDSLIVRAKELFKYKL